MSTLLLKDGSHCVIRRAIENDAAQIVMYSNAIGGETDFLSYGWNEFSQNNESERQVIREYNAGRNRLFIIAEIDREICGVLTFYGNNRKRLEHWGELGISVLQKHWNKGIGHALIDYLIKWAQRSEIVRKIDLMVREDNYSAIALYRKMGFEVEGRIRRAMRVNGKFYDFLYMGRLID